MPPRPILKGLPSADLSFASSESASNPLPFSSCPRILDSPHVHFPPTPSLTSTEITHSSFIYDRAPIVVSPNTCALPERGDRKVIGRNSNKGGLGYFHPHAGFQVDAARVEGDSLETASPAIFSASVTVGNVTECGSVGLFMKQRSGTLYEYEYDQQSSHAQHVITPLVFDCSSESSDLGVFCSSPSPYVPTSSLSSTCSPSIPHPSVNFSSRNVYNTSTAPPSPSLTANHNIAGVHDGYGYPSPSKAVPLFMSPSSSISISGSPHDNHQDKKKSSVDADGKRRRKSREYTHNRAEGGSQTKVGTQRTTSTSREFELEGCLGGF